MVARNISTHQVRALATFGNSAEQHEIVSCTVNYELSGIPSLQMSMPLGVAAGTDIPATTHKLISTFDVVGSDDSKVFVYLEVNDAPNHPDGEHWPQDAILIFEGYVTGLTFQKTRKQISLVIQARHWLSDLAYGSCLSANAQPGSPMDFLMPASGAGSAQNNQTGFMSSHIADDVTLNDLQTDFWVLGLHDWLLKIAQKDFLDLAKINRQAGVAGGAGPAPDTNNKTVIKALARMTGGYKYEPLILNADNQLTSIAQAVSSALDKQTYRSFNSTTMWNKLVGEFCPNYMFAVCPRVNNAYAIPYIPGYRKPWQVIKSSEYTALDTSAQMDRLLRAVGITSVTANRTGGEQNPGQQQSTRLGGYYSPEDIKDGLIMFKQAPSWLSNIVSGSFRSGGTAPYGAPVASSTSPQAGEAPTEPDPSELVEVTMDLMDRYAKSVYVYEMLNGRRASVSGKLRLDIAPGSTVRIEGTESRGVPGGGGGTAQDLIATVISVTININGDKGIAGTSFQLSHARTVTENDTEGFSVDTPPLWKNGWSGTSLVDQNVPGRAGI